MMFMGLLGFGSKVKEEQGTKKVAEAKEAIKVSAEDLFQAYKGNEVSANQKYKGKVVELTGTVHAVKERYVELNEDNSAFILGFVHVQFDGASKDKMASLNKGQLIRVKGICTGKSFASVEISNAQLLE